jgi:hypothetical protein
VTYRAAVISHSPYERDEETASGELTITMSAETPIVSELNGEFGTSRPVTLTIRQTHRRRRRRGDADDRRAVQRVGRREGRSREWPCASSPSRRSRRCSSGRCCAGCAGRRATRRSSAECGVDPAPFTTHGLRHLRDLGQHAHGRRRRESQADGYYTAGYLVVESGTGAGERRFIASHVGSTLVLLHDPPRRLTTADTIAITAGCDGVEATCETKFANIDHFGGFPACRA